MWKQLLILFTITLIIVMAIFVIINLDKTETFKKIKRMFDKFDDKDEK